MTDPFNEFLQTKPQAPNTDVESVPFWQAANEGRLLIKRCKTCAKPNWYPRATCPHCASPDTYWEDASGKGVVYSFSIMRRSPNGAFALAYVALDEGVTILSNIINISAAAIFIGMPVQVCFQPTDNGGLVPVFEPAEPSMAGTDDDIKRAA